MSMTDEERATITAFIKLQNKILLIASNSFVSLLKQ